MEYFNGSNDNDEDDEEDGEDHAKDDDGDDHDDLNNLVPCQAWCPGLCPPAEPSSSACELASAS